jgi:hypothetical protein
VLACNWWNEALHRVAQGCATVFPQAIGLANWTTGLMLRVVDTISTEARRNTEVQHHPRKEAAFHNSKQKAQNVKAGRSLYEYGGRGNQPPAIMIGPNQRRAPKRRSIILAGSSKRK